MKTVNEMKLCVPSKSCNEAFARCVVSAFVMSLDPTVNELSDLKTAVSEAVTNCIVHGYRHQSGTIYINGKITSENKVIITIRDKGCGISDIKKAMEPLFNRSRGGQGRTRLCSYAELLRQGACPFKARQRNNRNS